MSSTSSSSFAFDLPFELPTVIADLAAEFNAAFAKSDLKISRGPVPNIFHNLSDIILPTVEGEIGNAIEDALKTKGTASLTADLGQHPRFQLLPAVYTAQRYAPSSAFNPVVDIPKNAAAFTTIDNNGKQINDGQGPNLSAQRKWTRSDGKSDGRNATVVTFAFDDSFSVNGIDTARAKTLLTSALQTWADYSPLDFVEIADPGSSDLVDILAQSKAIDGQGKTLAFAFFPNAGDITFDTDEIWSERKFLETAVHELGHSLGLDHEDDAPAIMNSILNNRFTEGAFLLEDDINGIRSLYGSGKGSVTTLNSKLSPDTATPTTPVSAPVAAANLVVNGSFEDVPLLAGEYGTYSSIKGWTGIAGNGFQVDRRPDLIGQAAEGTAWVELDAYGANSTIGQNIDTLTGQTYQVSVDFSNGGRAESSTSVEVFWEGKKVDTLSGGGKGQWRKFSYQLKGGDRTVSTLAFRAIGPSDNVGGYIDNVVITAASGTLDQGLGSAPISIPTMNRDPISGEPQNLVAADLSAVSTAFI